MTTSDSLVLRFHLARTKAGETRNDPGTRLGRGSRQIMAFAVSSWHWRSQAHLVILPAQHRIGAAQGGRPQ